MEFTIVNFQNISLKITVDNTVTVSVNAAAGCKAPHTVLPRKG